MPDLTQPLTRPLTSPLMRSVEHALSEGVGAPAIDLLQQELESAGIWAELDGLYILAQSSEGLSYVNLKAPGANNLVAFGGPTFVANSHVAGDGVDAYLRAFQPPGTGNYKLNDAMVFLWTKGPAGTSNVNYAVGGSAAGTVMIAPRRSSTIQSRLNCGVTQSTYSPTANGAIGLDRSSSAGYDVFYNGEKIGSPVIASTSLPSVPIELLRLITTYSLNELQAFAIGGSLAALGADAHRTLYRAVSRCLNRLNAITDAAHRWAWGATTWYNSPRSMAFGDDVLAGAVHVWDGSIMAHLLPDDGEPTREFILDPHLQLDDHDNPAFLHDAVTGKYMAFWSTHTGPGGGTFMAISTNANDPTSWGSRIALATAFGYDQYSYHNVVQLSAESNRIYDFFRAYDTARSGFTGFVSYTDAQDGTGWQTGVPLFWTGRPYLIPDSDGVSRIDMNLTQTGVADLSVNSIYHCYYEGGNLYKSDGTLIGGLIADAPHAEAEMTLVFDGSGPLGKAQNFDIVRYPDGRIALGYATYADINNHVYRRALWAGGTWTNETICDAGGPIDDSSVVEYSQGYYSGGFVFDRDDPDVAYCSRKVGGSAVHQLFRLNRGVGGVWTATQLTLGTDPAFRPYHVKGTRKLTYNLGPYTGYEHTTARIAWLAI